MKEAEGKWNVFGYNFGYDKEPKDFRFLQYGFLT